MKIFIDDSIKIDTELLDEFDKQFFSEHSIYITKDFSEFGQQKCTFDGSNGEKFLGIISEVCEGVSPIVTYLPSNQTDHLDIRLIQKH
jgi:hypothetical protein